VKIYAVAPERQDPLFPELQRRADAQGWTLERHRGPLGEALEHGQLASADILVNGGGLICDAALFDAAPNLRAIVTPFIGTETIDEEEACRRGIVICNGQIPENFEGVAEGAILLVLAALYDLFGKADALRTGRALSLQLEASMLWRKTVGIVGYGKIAQAVARRLSTWDVELLVHTRSKTDFPGFIKPAGLDDLLRSSDVIIVLASLNEDSFHLIDAEKLKLLKPTALLANLSRGAVIDEAALYDWAVQNPDARIALDVFETEPLPAESALRTLPHAVLTPHAIAGTREVLAATRTALAENVAAVCAGEPMRVRNPAVLPGWKARWNSPAG